MIDKDKLMMVILKEFPSVEDRQLIAQYLNSIGGCPHLNKKEIKVDMGENLCRRYHVCLDCGAEEV